MCQVSQARPSRSRSSPTRSPVAAMERGLPGSPDRGTVLVVDGLLGGLGRGLLGWLRRRLRSRHERLRRGRGRCGACGRHRCRPYEPHGAAPGFAGAGDEEVRRAVRSPRRNVSVFSPSSRGTVMDHRPFAAVACWSRPKLTSSTMSAPSCGAVPLTSTVSPLTMDPSCGADRSSMPHPRARPRASKSSVVATGAQPTTTRSSTAASTVVRMFTSIAAPFSRPEGPPRSEGSGP